MYKIFFIFIIKITFGANDVKWLGGTKGVEGGPIPGCKRPVLKPE